MHRSLATTGELAERVTDELLAYIATSRVFVEPEAAPLLDELEALVTSGGKRLRPRFCYWGYRAAGGSDSPEILRVGAALELLHTMALIQDDVMDRSTTRRNRPTTASKLGPSAAILTGMLGFVLADRLFSSVAFDAVRKQRASERYDGMRARAIAGQYLDLVAPRAGIADEFTTRRIASLKSGSYTVADPLAIGALLASDDIGIVDVLDRYGLPLGEAFQLRDDVLGTFGDSDVTGKDRDGDLREGKQTVLLAKARAAADDKQREILEAHVGDSEMTHDDAEQLREVIVETGALRDTNSLIEELASAAKAALDASTLEVEAAAALDELADEATVRLA